jgi:hypothetical protein
MAAGTMSRRSRKQTGGAAQGERLIQAHAGKSLTNVLSNPGTDRRTLDTLSITIRTSFRGIDANARRFQRATRSFVLRARPNDRLAADTSPPASNAAKTKSLMPMGEIVPAPDARAHRSSSFDLLHHRPERDFRHLADG